MAIPKRDSSQTVFFRDIFAEMHHASMIFPEASDETITLTAGDPANTNGAWVEIVDNNAATLSSKFASNDGHIHSAQVETFSVEDKIYVLEIAWGDAKTEVLHLRFLKNADGYPIQQNRVLSDDIPMGETIYYRMMCETAGATCTVSIRYHLFS